MNKSRRKFLEKAPSIAIGTGVGVAAGTMAMASPAGAVEDGTRPLLNALIDGQAKINGRLYYSSDLMLDVLRELIANVPGLDVAELEAKINNASRYIEAVPGIKPPGCDPGGCC
jgi:hypothetical protein